jgi:hypothetical protein
MRLPVGVGGANLMVWSWKRIGPVLLALLASCAGEEGPLQEVGVWKDPATGAAAVFYRADPDTQEDDLRELAKAEGRRMLDAHPKATLYLFFDEARARRVHEETVRTGVPPPFGPATLLGGRNPPGGGILVWDREGDRRSWVYVPPQPVP